MKRKLLVGVGAVFVLGVIFVLALPTIVQSLGFHPAYEGESYEIPGRVLIVTTSHGGCSRCSRSTTTTPNAMAY